MKPTENIRRIQIPQGRKTTGQIYDRHVNLDPGMAQLVDIVAGLQKDVKRINQALTLEGAESYAASKGRNWSAHEADITGPNGKPDGIKEVFVADGKGNVKVINGYSLSKTTYPMRKLYQQTHLTKDDRRANPYNAFTNVLNTVNDMRDENDNWQYLVDLNDLPGITPENIGQYQGLRKEITPRKIFKDVFFGPRYDNQKPDLKLTYPPMVMAQIYNKALTRAYSQFVVNPILVNHFHIENPAELDKSALNKIIKSAEFKQVAVDFLNRNLGADDEGQLEELMQAVDGLILEVAGEF